MYSFILSLLFVSSFILSESLAQTQTTQGCPSSVPSNFCGANGVCGAIPNSNSTSLFTCICNTGYTGSRCEIAPVFANCNLPDPCSGLSFKFNICFFKIFLKF